MKISDELKKLTKIKSDLSSKLQDCQYSILEIQKQEAKIESMLKNSSEESLTEIEVSKFNLTSQTNAQHIQHQLNQNESKFQENKSKIQRLKSDLRVYLQSINVPGFIGTLFSLFELKPESEDYLNALNVISSGLHPIVMKNSNSLKKLFEVFYFCSNSVF
jgi:chromosome segregation ATPase